MSDQKDVVLEDRYLEAMLEQPLLERLAQGREERDKVKRILRRGARALRYPHKGEHYIRRGDEKRDLHFVVEGAVAVKRGSLTFRVISNDCIGIDRVFGDAPFSADLHIARPDTLIVRVTAEQMYTLAKDYSALHRRVLHFMGHLVRQCTIEVEVHRHLAVEARLARLLLQSHYMLRDSHEPESNAHHVLSPQMPYERRALAEEVGTVVRVITRTIGNLAEAGLVERGTRGGSHWVRVLDPEGLMKRIKPHHRVKPLYPGQGIHEWFMPEM